MSATPASRRQRRSSTPQRALAADRSHSLVCPGCGHRPGARPTLRLRALGTLHLYRGRSTCHADVSEYLPWLLECPCRAPFHRPPEGL
jgi:hypothetical protein